MKKYITVLLVFLICICPFSAYATDERDNLNINYLLTIDPEIALNIMVNNGLALPKAYLEDHRYAVLASQIVLKALATNPYTTYGYDYTELDLLAERMRVLFSDQINWNAGGTRSQGMYSETLYGDSYLSQYSNYNCYAFALGVTGSKKDPGAYSGITLSAAQMDSISSVRDAIIADLTSMGYSVSYSQTKPNSLTSGQHLICVRCSSTTGGGYHVMKANSLNVWHHKPQISAPLKLLDTSSTSPATYSWTNEMYYAYLCWTTPDITYSGTIYYFKYW